MCKSALPLQLASGHEESIQQILGRLAYKADQHPRFQAMLAKRGLDDNWRDELLEMANDLTNVTGIHVQLDEAY